MSTTRSKTKAPDRWIDMTRFDTIAAAQQQTGERALEALDQTLDLLSWLKTQSGRNMVESHIDAYAQWHFPDQRQAVSRLGFDLNRPETFTTQLAEQAPTKRVVAVESQRLGFDGAKPSAMFVGSWLDDADRVFGQGQTFYVNPRMCSIAAEIAADLDPLMLFPTDVPCSAGYLYLALPCVDPTQRGVGMPLRMIGWQQTERIAVVDDEHEGRETGHPGVTIMSLIEGDRGRRALDDFALRHAGMHGVFAQPTHRWVAWETTAWAFGTEWHTADDDEQRWLNDCMLRSDMAEDEERDLLPRGHIGADQSFMRRYLFAVWSLIKQEIAHVEPFRPDRHAARRMARQQPNFGDVLIVRLRRIFDPLAELTDDERGERAQAERMWSHRWRVREHWRNQACGPGLAERRMVLVQSYVKGPEHLPLIEKDKVISLER